VADSPEDILRRDREQATRFAEVAGKERTRKVLERANASLAERLRTAQGLSGPGPESFTATQLKTTLAQVRLVLRPLQAGIATTAIDAGGEAAKRQAASTARYMRAADERFTGVGDNRLAIDEGAMFDKATSGAHASILRRIASDPAHPGNAGVLARYGTAVIGKFEDELQQRFIARTPWDDVRDKLVEQSPFLKGAPAHWAERIVRTEVMGAQNRANWESIRTANETLGDMCKIISCTFDARTGADSIAIHGQIRRPEEAFESWFGMFQHPPDRPNDRAVVVPHRISWPIPDYLEPRSDSEVEARWRLEGRKGSHPARPNMSTIDRKLFGKEEAEEAAKKVEEERAPEQQAQPAEEAPKPTIAAEAPVQEEQRPSVEALQAAAQNAERPPVPRFRNEEARQAWARDRLAELPRHPEVTDDDVVLHRLPVATAPLPEELQARIDTLIAQVERLEGSGEAPATRQVRISELKLRFPDARAVHVLEDIHEENPTVPIVVRRGGELFVHRGTETVVARDLTGRKTIDARIIDLDAKKPFTPKLKPLPEVPKVGNIPIERIAASDYAAHLQAKRPDVWQQVRVSGAENAPRVVEKVFGAKGAPSLGTLEKVWGSDEHQIVMHTVVFGEGYGGAASVSYSGDIVDGKRTIGSIVRTFKKHEDGKVEVHHDYFRIDEASARGKGSGESMLGQSIKAYQHLGVNEITVDAAWVGKYTWATFGYNWDANDVDYKERSLAHYLVTRGSIDKARAERIAKQVAPRAWDVAALDVDGVTVIPRESMAKQVPTKLGKAFLLDSGMWSGTLKLDPKEETYKRAKERLKL